MAETNTPQPTAAPEPSQEASQEALARTGGKIISTYAVTANLPSEDENTRIPDNIFDHIVKDAGLPYRIKTHYLFHIVLIAFMLGAVLGFFTHAFYQRPSVLERTERWNPYKSYPLHSVVLFNSGIWQAQREMLWAHPMSREARGGWRLLYQFDPSLFDKPSPSAQDFKSEPKCKFSEENSATA